MNYKKICNIVKNIEKKSPLKIKHHIFKYYDNIDMRNIWFKGIRKGLKIGLEQTNIKFQKNELYYNSKNNKKEIEYLNSIYKLSEKYKYTFQYLKKYGMLNINIQHNLLINYDNIVEKIMLDIFNNDKSFLDKEPFILFFRSNKYSDKYYLKTYYSGIRHGIDIGFDSGILNGYIVDEKDKNYIQYLKDFYKISEEYNMCVSYNTYRGMSVNKLNIK